MILKMNTQINLAGITMKNPVMTASGTVGFGKEISEWMNLNRLGAFIPKTITLTPRKGNPPHRITETDAGMINSIGLANKGVDDFLENELPYLEQFNTPVIVNISGSSVEEYVELTNRVSRHSNSRIIRGIEANISCPNVKKGGMAFGTNPSSTQEVIRAIKDNTDKTLIAKLTPNVTNIVEIAEAAYQGGADVLSMINTLLGMSIDVEKRVPKIHGAGRYMGGLSGPAIRPIGVRCIYQVYKSGIPVPLIGIGGILTGNDALEYILAGATAIGVGTAHFVYPDASVRVIKGIEDYMQRNEIGDINELIGNLQDPEENPSP